MVFRSLVVVFLGLAVGYGCAQSNAETQNESETDESSSTAVESSSNAGKSTASTSARTTSEDSSQAENAEENRAVQAGAIQLTAPEGWKRRQPRSTILAAEFGLPKSEGDEQDGRLTVSIAGGSVDQNVDRWRSQFIGGPKNDSRKEESISGVTVTIVDYTGKFSDRRGPFAPATEYDGYRMIGAIIPAGGRLHFVKAYGPEKTIGQQRDSILKFLRSLKTEG